MAKVLVVEPLGKDVIVTANIEGELVKITLPSAIQLQPEQEIALKFDEKDVCLFDEKTGKANI